MDVNQGSTLPRNGLSRIVEAVQVEHVETGGHADEHHDSGNHVENALTSLPLKRPSVCRGRCNNGTHRLSPRHSEVTSLRPTLEYALGNHGTTCAQFRADGRQTGSNPATSG